TRLTLLFSGARRRVRVWSDLEGHFFTTAGSSRHGGRAGGALAGASCPRSPFSGSALLGGCSLRHTPPTQLATLGERAGVVQFVADRAIEDGPRRVADSAVQQVDPVTTARCTNVGRPYSEQPDRAMCIELSRARICGRGGRTMSPRLPALVRLSACVDESHLP